MSPLSVIEQLSPFLKYLSKHQNSGTDILPSLTDISKEMGISVSILREELEVAKALGLVEVKPRIGIKNLPFSFAPAVTKSLAYASTLNKETFKQFSDLRNHIEASYWYQAVDSLTNEDKRLLKDIVRKAIKKLNSHPIEIPHVEHRQLHLIIYSKLANLFVQGILEAYWDIYEAVGLSVYEDQEYLNRVWVYHQQMVDSISQGDYLSGYRALIAHFDLIYQREQKNHAIPFE
jgi:DNA-binding FadR family transcriptional regulator